ncbi:uncharacterized protein [Nicotiana sylvestris]|uniref:uncharacterized protein n=1 Tax=Nicotiana sylvestris TaxID=4096 RepID=UPI00388CBFB9
MGLKSESATNIHSTTTRTETRVKEHNMKKVCSHISPDWEILHNYICATNGRIWLIWDTRYYKVTLIRAEVQVVHCLVNGIIGDQECLLTVVYGYNTIQQRKQLWDNLIEIGHGVKKQWILGGDFKSILQLQDMINGNPVNLAEEGDYYTCSSKQDGMDRIWSRIDRIFGNYKWMMQWGHITTVYDVPFISDHAPMSLNLTRVYRWTMQDIWVKLKKLRPLLKKFNIEEFKFIRQKIDTARNELLIVQKSINASCTNDLTEKENNLIQSLEK